MIVTVTAKIEFDVMIPAATAEEIGKTATALNWDLTTKRIMLFIAYDKAIPKLEKWIESTCTPNGNIKEIRVTLPANSGTDEVDFGLGG